jgi:hypothetical protein
MKTQQEIEKEVKKTVGRIESLEHLIAEAELGIKMHRKELDVHSARLRGLQWCLETDPIKKKEEDEFPSSYEEEDESPSSYEEPKEGKKEKINITDKVTFTRIHTTFNTEKLCTFPNPEPELDDNDICPFPKTTCPKCAFFK